MLDMGATKHQNNDILLALHIHWFKPNIDMLLTSWPFFRIIVWLFFSFSVGTAYISLDITINESTTITQLTLSPSCSNTLSA